MEFIAPAKINLCLNILGKLSDGYHEIETVFEKIALFDKISVKEIDSPTKILSDHPGIPTDSDSLIMKTIDEFCKRTGCGSGFEVSIEKHIPVSAGMGGGSSDSACLLKALNKITGTDLDNEKLADIGAILGADIPFFIYGSSYAFGSGKGDVIEELRSDLKMWHIIVVPPFGASTKEIYDAVKPLHLTKKGGIDTIFGTFLEQKDFEAIADNLHNGLQCITLENFPALTSVMAALKDEGCLGVLVSGSGPVVFGLCRDEESARSIKDRLREEGAHVPDDWKILVASTY